MTQTSTPRPQISRSEGQRIAERIQWGLKIGAAVLLLATAWTPSEKHALLINAAMIWIVGAWVVVAMRALDRDRDGNPKGGDGEVGSVRSMTARSEGVAR